MPRALLKNGVIYPVDPLPADWRDGTELTVEKSRPADNGSPGHPTDQWMNEVESMASKIPAGEDKKLDSAIARLRKQAEDLARKGKR